MTSSHSINAGVSSEEDICFRCGHTRREPTWRLPSTGEIHQFKRNCGKCKCEKFVSPPKAKAMGIRNEEII